MFLLCGFLLAFAASTEALGFSGSCKRDFVNSNNDFAIATASGALPENVGQVYVQYSAKKDELNVCVESTAESAVLHFDFDSNGRSMFALGNGKCQDSKNCFGLFRLNANNAASNNFAGLTQYPLAVDNNQKRSESSPDMEWTIQSFSKIFQEEFKYAGAVSSSLRDGFQFVASIYTQVNKPATFSVVIPSADAARIDFEEPALEPETYFVEGEEEIIEEEIIEEDALEPEVEEPEHYFGDVETELKKHVHHNAKAAEVAETELKDVHIHHKVAARIARHDANKKWAAKKAAKAARHAAARQARATAGIQTKHDLDKAWEEKKAAKKLAKHVARHELKKAKHEARHQLAEAELANKH